MGAALVVLLETISAVAHGRSPRPPLKAVVLCARAEACDAFARRVRGQTVDLAMTVQTRVDDEFGPPDDGGSLDSQLERAEALARRLDADLVVWWRVARGGHPDRAADSSVGRGAWVILVRGDGLSSSGGTRVLTRPMLGGQRPSPAAAHAGPSSVDQESGALIVRGAAQAVLAGQPVGDPRPVAAPAAPAPRPAPPPVARPVPTPPAVWRGFASVALAFTHDGVPADPGPGVVGRAGATRGPWSAGALWNEGLTDRLQAGEAVGDYRRRQVGGLFGRTLLESGAWTGAVAARVGVVMTHIVPYTGPFREMVDYARPFLGAELQARWFVKPGRLAVLVAAGIDVVHDPVTIVIRSAVSDRPYRRISVFQPFAAAGVELLLP